MRFYNSNVELILIPSYELHLIILHTLHRDADDAVHGRNNYSYDGYRLRVEIPRGSSRYDDRPRTSNYVRGKPGPPSKRTDFRVLIEGTFFYIYKSE